MNQNCFGDHKLVHKKSNLAFRTAKTEWLRSERHNCCNFNSGSVKE